jgi:hypothetical protein
VDLKTVNQILTFIGGIVAVGGTTTAIAYGLFVWLGRRWIENAFANQLERFRHERAKELEHLRHDIGRLFSRISKIHEREFAALPEAWSKLVIAHGKASSLAFPLKQVPDFRRMSAEQIDDFLETTPLPEFRRKEVREADDKTKTYVEARFWLDLGDATRAQNEFHNFIGENWIFLTDELRDGFLSIDKQIRGALIDVEVDHDLPKGSKERVDSHKALKNLEPAVEELGRLVQRRLHYEDA